MTNAGLCPPIIVVGIVHPDRMTDLTFGTDNETPGIVGSGDKFMLYMEKELMPFIESNYPTAPYNIFIGHSVGGLTVVNTLIHHPNLVQEFANSALRTKELPYSNTFRTHATSENTDFQLESASRSVICNRGFCASWAGQCNIFIIPHSLHSRHHSPFTSPSLSLPRYAL